MIVRKIVNNCTFENIMSVHDQVCDYTDSSGRNQLRLKSNRRYTYIIILVQLLLAFDSVTCRVEVYINRTRKKKNMLPTR